MQTTSQRRAIAGLALSLGTLAVAVAAPALKGDPEKAIPIVTERCSGCHGMDGNSPLPNFPRLAGLHPEFLLKELKEYKAEHRDSDVMKPMAADLDEQDMLNLAAYFAAQIPTPGTVTQPELLELGKKIYLEGNEQTGVPSCAGCHEEDGSGSVRFPRVAGQNPEYTVEELKRYANGSRRYGKKLMRTVAERLSEQEAQAVAQYIASLK